MSVVVDCGTDTTKAGLSYANGPSVIFPTIVGIPKWNTTSIKGIYVGSEAYTEIRKEKLDPQYPLEDGIVKDWDAMEALWQHTFDVELKLPSNPHIVLLSEPPMNPRENREKTAHIIFEGFNVEGFYLCSTAVLSLYPIRRLNGLVVTSGDGVTYCVPVYDGSAQSQGTLKFDLAGKDITAYLGTLLEERGCTFPSSMAKEMCVREIKEKFSYVADDFAEEMASPIGEENYNLPDKTVITIGKERFKCAEAIFQPYLAGRDTVGIHKFVYQSIMKCDPELHGELYDKVVLSGGSTLFPYLPRRLQREITILAPADVPVNVIATSDRQDAAWLGGSILSEMSTFKNMLISRKEYDEYGPVIVQRKCY